VQYTIVPVSGKEDLARAFHEHSEQVMGHIFMYSCNGTGNYLAMEAHAGTFSSPEAVFLLARPHFPSKHRDTKSPGFTDFLIG